MMLKGLGTGLTVALLGVGGLAAYGAIDGMVKKATARKNMAAQAAALRANAAQLRSAAQPGAENLEAAAMALEAQAARM